MSTDLYPLPAHRRPAVPEECRAWCAAQPAWHVVGGEWVSVDLTWWNGHLARRSIPVRLRAGGPDGGVVEDGPGYLSRSDLWAAGRHAPESVEDAVIALYMCAAWLRGHPLRGTGRRFPDFRFPDGHPRAAVDGFPAVIRDVADRLDDPADALVALLGSSGPAGEDGVPELGAPLATLYLSSLAVAEVDAPMVPVDHAGIASLVHSGWTGVDALTHLTPRRYRSYVELVDDWADEAGTDPLLVEMWLVHRWHERCRGVDVVAPSGGAA